MPYTPTNHPIILPFPWPTESQNIHPRPIPIISLHNLEPVHQTSLDLPPLACPSLKISLINSSTIIPINLIFEVLLRLPVRPTTKHSALDCYYRMDYAYKFRHPPTQLAAMVANTNTDLENQEWLADSGAITHITADVSTISKTQPFEDTETVGVGNFTGLEINWSGSFMALPTHSNLSTKSLLKYILLCPSASANLLSINKFCVDKNYHFILTVSYFLVKNNLTRTADMVFLSSYLLSYLPYPYLEPIRHCPSSISTTPYYYISPIS
jgi:hypothetical protein